MVNFDLLDYTAFTESWYYQDHYFCQGLKIRDTDGEEIRQCFISILKRQEKITLKSRSFIDTLPLVCQRQILISLDHMSLINFSKAFENFQQEVVNPVYWKDILIYSKDNLFFIEDLIDLGIYLKDHLKTMYIYVIDDNFKLMDDIVREFFKYLNKLEEICIHFTMYTKSDLIDSICENMCNLKSLEIRWQLLTNEHLVIFADSLPYLESLYVGNFDQDLSVGMNYFLRKRESVKGFGLFSKTISNE